MPIKLTLLLKPYKILQYFMLLKISYIMHLAHAYFSHLPKKIMDVSPLHKQLIQRI
jgi:hypothetical protein